MALILVGAVLGGLWLSGHVLSGLFTAVAPIMPYVVLIVALYVFAKIASGRRRR